MRERPFARTGGGKAMPALHRSRPMLEPGLRWTARLLAAGLVGLIVVIYVGEGFNPLRLSPLEVIQKVFFWTACLGLLAAWRWPVLGGALSTGGLLLFLAVGAGGTGGLPKGAVFYRMLVPGLLFMGSGFLRRRSSAG